MYRPDTSQPFGRMISIVPSKAIAVLRCMTSSRLISSRRRCPKLAINCSFSAPPATSSRASSTARLTPYSGSLGSADADAATVPLTKIKAATSAAMVIAKRRGSQKRGCAADSRSS